MCELCPSHKHENTESMSRHIVPLYLLTIFQKLVKHGLWYLFKQDKFMFKINAKDIEKSVT